MRMLAGQRTLNMVLMLVSVVALFRFVSVVSVAQNFSHVSVGQIGDFAISALRYTEGWTLVALALFAYATFSFIRTWVPERSGAQFA